MKKEIICGSLVLAVLLGTAGCTKAAPQTEQESLLDAVGVWNGTTTVVRRDLEEAEYLSGTVTAVTDELSFEIDGIVQECALKIGDHVSKYQTLLVLDEAERLERLQELQDEYDRMKQQYELDQAVWQQEMDDLQEQLQQLQADDGGDPLQLSLLELEIEERERAHQQELEEQEEALAQQEEQYDQVNADVTKNYLCAPCDGVVVALTVQQGDSVKAGQCVIAIADDEGYYLRVSKFFSQAKYRDQLAVKGYIGDDEIELGYMAYTDDELRAATDQNTGTVSLPARFSFNQQSVSCALGDAGIVKLVSDAVTDVLCVRQDAILSDASGSYVYKKTDTGRQRVNVVTGLEDGMYIEIVSGDLQEGDEIYVQE
jgi:multidrug efflux pump subunit AcrA (membrane-fusion protein)